jgi:macrolide transport system ATP-binding/permease protein
MALLRDLAQRGHTIVLITHDRSVAEQAGRIIEIHDGRITADSGPVAASADPQPVLAQAAVEDRGSSFASDAAEAAKMALRALRTNPFRTLLTLLGVMIGVASVVAMLAVGQGAKQQVLDRIGSMGSNLLVVRPGAPNQRVQAGSSVRTLTVDDATAVAGLPNVEAAVPEQQENVTLRIGNRDYATQAIATTTDMPTVRTWPVARGTFFSADDVNRYATVAVIGTTVAQNLFPDGEDPLGRSVIINNILFRIIGVMSSKGATSFGQDQDDVIFLPVTTGGLRLFGETYVRSITVAVSDVAKIADTQKAINALLSDRHGKVDFQIRNMAALMETISATANTLAVLLGSIAAISLIVGGIGVMNIMLMSVTERTREIGIRMATGATTRNILQQFMTEAVVVSGVGGVLGVVLGFAGGLAVALAGLPLAFTAWPVLLAFACAVLTGLLFGLMPALKASRLDPVVALASD